MYAENSGIYWLQVTNICGSITDSISVNFVYCGNIYIPNIITPNDDNINDYFKIKGIENQVWGLQIFNRWGNLIYETDNYKNEWNAEKQTDGTYFYILKNREFNELHKGFIQVFHK
jgi:gliding motility-associated-like protein